MFDLRMKIGERRRMEMAYRSVALDKGRAVEDGTHDETA